MSILSVGNGGQSQSTSSPLGAVQDPPLTETSQDFPIVVILAQEQIKKVSPHLDLANPRTQIQVPPIVLQSEPAATTIQDISPDLILKILDFLPPEQRSASCKLTCKAFATFANALTVRDANALCTLNEKTGVLDSSGLYCGKQIETYNDAVDLLSKIKQFVDIFNEKYLPENYKFKGSVSDLITNYGTLTLFLKQVRDCNLVHALKHTTDIPPGASLEESVEIIQQYLTHRDEILLKLTFDDHNFFCIPQEVCNLTCLYTIDARRSYLRALPPQIAKLTNLHKLNLSENDLTSLPREIGRLSLLQKLDLGGNNITFLPEELWNLASLQRLFLSNNQLTSLPRKVGKLTALVILNVSNNHILSVPSEIGNLLSLAVLDLSDNQLTSVPAEIERLNSLECLNLSQNQLSQLPSQIEKLPSLRWIYWSNNPLSSPPVVAEQLKARGVQIL